MDGKHILKLLDEPDCRISIGDKWMVLYKGILTTKGFIVYQRKRYQKYTRVLIETEDEQEACRYLKGG